MHSGFIEKLGNFSHLEVLETSKPEKLKSKRNSKQFYNVVTPSTMIAKGCKLQNLCMFLTDFRTRIPARREVLEKLRVKRQGGGMFVSTTVTIKRSAR